MGGMERGGWRAAGAATFYWKASAWKRIGLLCALGGTLVAGGCGAGGSGSATRVPLCADQESQQKMAAVFDLLEEVGMQEWADYGREFLSQGKIIPVDFSARSANPLGLDGVDATANFRDGKIYVDKTIWQVMPMRLLADVMLDECAHFRTRSTDHTLYYQLQTQLMRAWEAKYGRPWGEYGPEDALWVQYITHPEQFN